MTLFPFPFPKDKAEALVVDGPLVLDWYTGILTNGATEIIWPGEVFPQGAFALIGNNVVALRLSDNGNRLRTTWFDHTLDAVSRVREQRQAIFDAFVRNWRKIPDAEPFIV